MHSDCNTNKWVCGSQSLCVGFLVFKVLMFVHSLTVEIRDEDFYAVRSILSGRQNEVSVTEEKNSKS